MTNAEIISGCCELYGITEEVDTYKGWQRRGKQVNKGSKALFKTKIWKPVGKSSNPDFTDDDIDHMIMVTGSFFGKSQVIDTEEAK